ncbi:MAG: HDIG domain-containing protein [Dysgonamonadaceae bacterium]|jgi:putative nucleotidyltransferase with HDIG domain|nr:HDIG domain-containing protein [Dysgonamonadaceae bacterium]
MKRKIKFPVYVYFIVLTAIIVILFPRTGKFRYTFIQGKPWQYGLLTAPFDFPIYKSPEHLKVEKDSVLSHFIPYFQLDDEVYLKQQGRFDAGFAKHQDHWKPEYKAYIDAMLLAVYTAGIVSAEDYDFLQNNRYATLNVLQRSKNTTIPYATADVFTIKSAYSYLLDNCPAQLNVSLLRSVDLNDYLHENIKYDAVLSETVKKDDLQTISPSSGMVQAGEKIVDRGEIVNEQTYNILRSLKRIYERQEGTVQRQTGLTAGVSILTAGLMACFLLYLVFFRKKIYASEKDVLFLLFNVSLFIFLTEVCIRTGFFNVYIIPYAIIPIVIRTFFESRTAQTTHLITVLICSLMVPFAFEFILIQFLVCTVALYVLKDLTKRSELITCAVYILAAYTLSYIGIQFLQEGNLTKINWNMFIYFGINFLFVMFTYAFIYIVEKLFGYVSNVTLVELSDINLPALSQLSERCPGTFQHSLQVSMLGTAAAVKVKANPQLVRTGALYHDLGKITNPAYFTENALEGNNPHANLTFEQSARIITNHVPEGVKQAESYGLPPALIKFIRTHHGKGKAKYFYNSYKNEHPDEPVDEQAFSYSGMNPDTRETAILMMADAVEAASRSLSDFSEASIRGLVNKIIDGQIADGLLNDAPLTFKNITTIKDVFVDKLLSVYHSRVSYPELK